jgi:hypothetical protein
LKKLIQMAIGIKEWSRLNEYVKGKYKNTWSFAKPYFSTG